jgi:hypothetical protein
MKPWLILAGGIILGLLAHNAMPVFVDYVFAADASGSNTRPFGSFPALTFATLPPAVTGTMAYISDGAAGNCGDGTCTTFGTTVTGGGGSVKILAWWNGSNWTLVGK